MFRLGLYAVIATLVPAGSAKLTAAPFVAARNAQCVAFSPNGKLLATGKSGMSNSEFPPRPHPSPRKCGVIELWDVESGKRQWRKETFGDLTRIAFSPDGKTLASSRLFATSDGVALNEVRLYDVASGKSIHEFSRCHGFEFSDDGKMIAVLSRTRCVLFSASDRQRLHVVKPLGKALCVKFAPKSHQIAGICRTEDGDYLVRVCDVEKGDLLSESSGLDQPFYNFCYSPRGDLIATGHGSGNVLLWDATRMNSVARLQTGAKGHQHAFFSPDGTIVGVGDQELGDVVFFEVKTSKELHRWTYKQGSIHTHLRRDAEEKERPEKDPQRFGFSPDGTSFVAGCHGALIRVVDTGQILRQFGD